MVTDDNKPKVITEDQETGKKYIVFDRLDDPEEWNVAHFERDAIKLADLGIIRPIKGEWVTDTIEPRVIHPTHYVEIAYDVV